MKLKLIATVVGLTLSAASQAQIVPPSTQGGSDLLLDVWEQGASASAPDQSFTLNLGMTMTQFLASDATSSTLATLLSNDSTWTGFLASSSPVAGDLQWSVIASGNKVPTIASFLSSVSTGAPLVDAASQTTSADVNRANTAVSTYVSNLGSLNEEVNAAPSAAYYQTTNLASLASNGWSNGNAIGATGVELAQATAVKGTNTQWALTVMPGTLNFVQDATTGNYVLSYNVAAVPEAPGFGLALAGIAALAFLALRRKNA